MQERSPLGDQPHELVIGDDVVVTLSSGRRLDATFEAVVVDGTGRAFLSVLLHTGAGFETEQLPLRHVARIQLA